ASRLLDDGGSGDRMDRVPARERDGRPVPRGGALARLRDRLRGPRALVARASRSGPTPDRAALPARGAGVRRRVLRSLGAGRRAHPRGLRRRLGAPRAPESALLFVLGPGRLGAVLLPPIRLADA